MHAHDVRKADWRDHRALDTGVIDLPALFGTLREIDYPGLLQLELEEPKQEAAPRPSKARMKELIAGRTT